MSSLLHVPQALGVGDCWGCMPIYLWSRQKMDTHIQAPPGEPKPARNHRCWPPSYSSCRIHSNLLVAMLSNGERSMQSSGHSKGFTKHCLGMDTAKDICVSMIRQ